MPLPASSQFALTLPAWKLETLHHVAVALTQLHKQQIAHQDLKPSNVLIFESNGTQVCDLGRAICERIEAPHQENIIAGDRGYAPPELLYGYVAPDIIVRRYSCDAYLLGSLASYLFLGVPFTPLLFYHLREEHRPASWTGDFQGVLPYLRDAAGFAFDTFGNEVPEYCRDELKAAIKQLCDPDPALRGHPRTRASVGNSYALERYISLFDRLTHLVKLRRN